MSSKALTVHHGIPKDSPLRWALPGRVFALLKETADAWFTDNVPRLSASLAFYTVLSIIPFLIVVVAIATPAFGQKAVQGQLIWELQGLIGYEGAQAIQGLITADKHSPGITVVGLLALAFGTSAVVMELRDSLNTIWHAPAETFAGVAGFMHMVRERFYLFGLIAVAGFLLVASLALNAIVVAINAQMGTFLPISPVVLHGAVFIGSFVVVTALFAAIYKLVPDVRLRWSDVIVGASVTSFIFSTGKYLIGLYLGRASYGSTYGAAGSFVIVLVWVYYSAQLFFFGAEFTRVYARNLHPRREIGVGRTKAALTAQGELPNDDTTINDPVSTD